MASTNEIEIVSLNRFDGMTSDQREPNGYDVSLLQHFNPYARPYRLTPYVAGATQNGDSASASYEMGDFLYYNGIVHGLGHASGGTTLPTIRTKDALDSSTAWTSHTNNASSGTSGTTLLRGVFVEYKDAAYGGYGNSTSIWKCKLDWSSFTDNFHDPSLAITSNGLNASYNSTLYFGCGNTLISYDGSTWNNAVLALSSRYSIVSIAEFDHYLAIGCAPTKGAKSMVFLWDMNTQPTRPDVSIDWGTGTLITVKQVEEYLIGVSSEPIVDTNTESARLVFRQYLSGSAATKFRQLITSSSVNFNAGGHSIPNSQVVNGKLYFAADLTLGGTEYSGLWAVGRKLPGAEYSVWFDRTPLGDTVVRTCRGFLLVSEHAFISYDNGGTYDMSGSRYSLYTGSSIVETSFNQGMKVAHRTRQKQLLAIAVSMVPLPSGGTCILKYSLDGASFTTAKTETTIGTVTTEMPLSGLSGTNGREIKLRVESKGGVEITEIKYKYEALETLI